MKPIFVLIFFAISFCSWCQSSFTPRNLGPGVNSLYDEINPVVSPDGKFLFFVRSNHPENKFGEADSQDIWYSERLNDSTWSIAKRIPNLNIGRYNSVHSISADGKTIFLHGVYNKSGTLWKKRGVSISTRNDLGWSTPERVKISKLHKRNEGLLSSASTSWDGKVMVLSYSKKYNGKQNDLYISTKKKSNRWTAPKRLKDLSSHAHEEAPFLSNDLKTIFFTSNRSGDFVIYRGTRTTNDWTKWSKPVPLSDTINRTGWDSYFKTNPKGSWAYFASTRQGNGQSDLFTVKLFEENPFVIASGTVINAKSQQPLTGRDVSILVNGKTPDSLRYNKDSATYWLKLPLGQRYEITTSLNNFIATPATLDVSSKKEFTKTTLPLYLEPIPYALVRGRILDHHNGQPITSNYQPSVSIKGVPKDSIKIDRTNATYVVNLLHGKSYELRAEAIKHEPTIQAIDLSAISEYQEVTRDVTLREEKMAIVSGKILDKKTNKPLAKLSSASVQVEGMTQVFATIDTVSGNYELKLALGANYTISANAPNYYPLYENVSVANEKTDVRIYKDLIIVPIEVGQSIRLNNIFFDPAKSLLKPESFPELDRVAEFLNNNTSIKIEIGGHTDNVGNAAGNLKLSQSRAQAVADYVIKKGVAKDRVVAKGYGLTKPVASNATKEGKAQNRRVEFTVLDN